MRTWEIAKLFVESCTSPEEVDQLIGTLQDRDAMLDICTKLAAFSSDKRESTPQSSKTALTSGSPSHILSSGAKEAIVRRNEEKLIAFSDQTIADELKALFRGRGMTNTQVEQWARENFGVKINVSKDSLHKYITRILKISDSQLVNRMVVAARKMDRKDNSSLGTRKAGLPIQTKKKESDKRSHRGTVSFGGVSASQLETLFRTMGMTNKQVEEWITNNFTVSTLAGKDSLRKYLTKVLNDSGLGLTNRILAAAQRLVDGETSSSSDIRKYWDEQDRHFSAVQ